MRLPSWDNITDYVSRSIPGVFPVRGQRRLTFVVGDAGTFLALRLPRHAGVVVEVSPFKELTFDVRVVESHEVIELSTRSAGLFYSFYLFACAVVDLMEDENSDPQSAIAHALKRFGQLFERHARLSDSVILGLLGELDLLSAILNAHGPSMFAAWLGPLRERHDFRIGHNEIEVKATVGAKRRHIVNGLDQLVPSPQRSLFILSLHYERAGANAGHTVPSLVKDVEQCLAGSHAETATFHTYLGSLGYRKQDADFYQERMQARSIPSLIPVDEFCPRVTKPQLEFSMPRTLSDRILEVDYQIDVTGMGFPEGSPEFDAVLPALNFRTNSK